MNKAERDYYRRLGVEGEDLAKEFMAGKIEFGPVARIIEKLTTNFLKGKVYHSRKTATGVYRCDADDLVLQTQVNIMKTLEKRSYKPEGKFKAYVLTSANNAFLDALEGKKGKVVDRNAPAAEGSKLPDKKGVVRTQEYLDTSEEVYLDEREILCLVLRGLRKVTDPEWATVWVARSMLGLKEGEVTALFDLNRNTCASHFLKSGTQIYESIISLEEYKNISFKGLRKFLKLKLTLDEQKDLGCLDQLQKKAVLLAVRKPLSLSDFASKMGLPIDRSCRVLRSALMRLAQAKLTRVPAMALGDELALWDAVESLLDCYPEEPVVRRGKAAPASIEELVALSSICLMLVYSGEGEKSLGELLAGLVKPEEIESSAKKLKLDPEDMHSLLADTYDASAGLLKDIEKVYGLSGDCIRAAVKTSQERRSRGGTRAMSREALGAALKARREKLFKY